MPSIPELLQTSAARHDHLCPRQVLGVRMGLAGLAILDLEPPVTKSKALVIVETDGCFVDGIEVATGVTVGHRSLRIVDLGKIAATFVGIAAGKAVRLVPRDGIRALAHTYAPEAAERYAAQLQGYAAMPSDELFMAQDVILHPPLAEILSRPDARAACSRCGEEIINEREVVQDGTLLCRTCAGAGYYTDPDFLVDRAVTRASPNTRS
ncbi:MAG TPA: FmdE family protein [Anaerolineales bacterium]|nr:FmdE family protein [Anaerolineales bacterium]